MKNISTLPANLKKSAIAFLAVLFCLMMTSERGWGQTTLYTQNFGTGTTFPAGWTASGSSVTWAVVNSQNSAGYTGASGQSNVQVVDNGSGTKILTFNNSLSTVGYSNITVIWGARRNASGAPSPTFQWSIDGTTWNTVAFTDVGTSGNWALANNGTAIALPVGAAGQANLQLRWSVTTGNTNSLSYRLDDITVQGTLALPTITSFTPTSACAGTAPTITITGTNFTGATAVKFNGVNATSFSVTSATTISAGLSSSGVTTGPITVTTPVGTATSSSNFTINAAPVISGQPANQTTCAGTAQTFNVTLSAGTAPAFQWQYNGTNVANGTPANVTYSVNSTATQSTLTVTPAAGTAAGIYTYQCIITVAGCATATSGNATLTVNPSPTLFTVTGGGGYCSTGTGSPVGLSGSQAGVSYQLYNGGTAVGSPLLGTGSAISFGNQTAVGTYTVSASNLVPPACPVTMTGNAVISILPLAPATVTYSTNPATYCAGVAITNNSPTTTSGGAPTSYSVSPALPAGLTLSTTTGVISGTPTTTTGVATATYTVTSTNSCGSATTGVSITISPAAPSALSYTTTLTSYCVNTLIANNTPSNSGGTPTSYSVSPALPAGLSFSTTTGVISGTPTAVTASATYTVTATNSCGSTTQALTIAITSVGSWIGVTSTDWFTASNWACGIIPTATTDVTIPASGVSFQPTIAAAGAVCHGITNNGTLTVTGANNLDVTGDWTNNGTFTAGSGSVTFKGSSNNTMAGTSATTFYNLIVNKSATANTLTSTTKAFTSTGTITVTQGDLILTATDVSYAANNITVPAAGILTDNVNWNGTLLLSVTGNIAVDGIFNYTAGTPHVNMNGTGNKTVHSGTNPASGFGYLTLSTGNYTADGQLVINSNFWPMFGTTGSFSTNGQIVNANGGVLMNGGTLNINGGTLNVTGGVNDGYAGLAATVNFTSGTLNTDFINVGDGTRTGVFNNSGGTVNVSGNILINLGCSYVCSTSPVINIAGNWTNNGAFTAATSQVNFNGSAAQTIAGTSVTTYNNLSIANAAGVTLSTSTNVNNILNLSNGLITTGASIITVAAAGSITNASASSYINGKLAQGFAAAGSKTFPTGKGGNYRPLTFNFTALSAATTITVEQIEGTLSGAMNPTTVVLFPARYWNITKSNTGNTFTYFITLDGTGFTPSGLVKMIKQESGTNNSYATTGGGPTYTNAAPGFTTFAGGTNGTNSFALGSDCSSSANAGTAPAAFCQGGTSAALNGSYSGTGTGAVWSTTSGGTFNPNATTLNATWTPPAAFFGNATLVLTPTGGICNPAIASSITVTVNGNATIALTSSAATNSQTLCINNAITNITYAIGGGGTGATVTGLPTGVNGIYNAGVYTISGTPSVAGTFNYTVTTTGPCITPSLTGAITVNPDATITLSSAAGTNVQTLCQNAAITNITYAIGGSGTGASIVGLPTGVTGVYNAGVFTISGTPTVSGTFNYTISTTGPCVKPTATGTIIVNPLPTGTLAETDNSGTTNNDSKICAGDNATFTFSTAGLGSYIFKVNGIQKQSGTSNIFSSITLNNGDMVTVDVANGSNCGATFGPITMIVSPLPAPTLTVTPGTTICPNAPFTLTATPNDAGATYSFIINGTTVSSGSSNTYTTTAITTNSTVAIMETNSNGCQFTTATQNITVSPVPSGTLSPASVSVCPATSVTFTATAIAGATYQFFVSSVSQGAASASNTFTTSSLTNGQVVTVMVTNASGCSATFNAVPVTVNPSPTGILNALENSGTQNDNSICSGAPVTFTFSNTTYSNYNFKVNGISKQNSGAASYVNSMLAAGDAVTVDVTNGSGCIATFSAPAITIAPSPSGTLSASPTTVCAGSNVTFTATPGFSNYNFKVNGATVANGASNTYTSTVNASTDVITVDVTNSNSCTTTFNSVSVTVTPSPTVVTHNQTVCSPNTVDLTAAAVTSGSTSGLTFSYFTDPGASVVYSTPTTAGAGTYYIKGTTAGGCSSITPVTVTVNSLPAVAAITGSNNVCVNSTTSLSDATSGGSWSSDNTSVATVNATGVVTGVSAGTANITYTTAANSNGCTNSTTTSVTVNALPVVAAITGNFNVCTTYTSQLSDATANGSWSSSNTAVATVNNSGLVTGVSAGTATISYTVTNGSGCTTTVTANINVSSLPSVAPITTTAPSSFNVCIGSTIPLQDATPSGTWSSSNTSVATISASGVVSGLTAGNTNISYTINTTCGGTQSVIQNVTVNTPPSASIIYAGGPAFCTSASPVSATQTGTTGGTYSSTSGLTINSGNGTITPATSTAGTYTVTYTVAAAGGCGVYTTTASVIITQAPSATIAYGGTPFCSSAAPVNVTMSGTTGGTYSSASGLSINAGTGTFTPSSSTPGTYTVTYTIAASGGCAAFSTTTSVAITAAPSAVISYTGTPFCASGLPVNPTRTGTAGGSYSSTTGLTINAAGTITPSTSTAGTYTVTYTVAAAGGCSLYTTTTIVTISPLPTATISGTANVCQNAAAPAVTFTGASGTAPYTYTYTVTGTPGNQTVNSTGNTATITQPTGTVGTYTYTLISVSSAAGCNQNQSGTATITVNAPPAAPTVTISPSNATVCQGSIGSFSAGTSPYTTSVTATYSGPALAIPDNSTTGVASPLTISGIPATATINSVSVTLINIQHQRDYDLEINLKGPNGNVLNLVDQEPFFGSGANFTNTVINSTSGNPLFFSSPPFTGTFAPDGSTGVGATGYNANVTSFSSLIGTPGPNGNWTLSLEDINSGKTGALNSWSITINYSVPATSTPVTWSPVTDLYTDPGASTAYTGQSIAVVYVKPATSGTKSYTATATNAANCTNSTNVSLTVNAIPTVSITADYCSVSGYVVLTATHTTGSTVTWNNGKSQDSIHVDVAGNYKATATNASGCTATATISVANELVTNGNFESGDVGFTSSYGDRTGSYYNGSATSGLYPEGYYAVDVTGYSGYPGSPVGYHPVFFGMDHTSGSGKYMIVNGAPSSSKVWQETVNVLPNTTYYFSAWGMSLNNVGPFASLQFNVNGTQVGSVATLTAGVNNQSNNGWTRFYGTLTTSATTTSAVISITDIQTATGGNDFGLDDISFGTLSTFVSLQSAAGTDAQTVCVNNAITNIVYSAGSSASSPTVTGLPSGVTSSWNGVNLTISGTPTVAGNYSYTVTTTGSCQPYSATGTITVKAQKIVLSSGNSSPSVCVNGGVNIGFTLSGTATGAAITGQPAGVTGAVSGSGPTYTYTISGTTTAAAGSYPYTITTSGTNCTPATFNGTITVTSQTITLNSGNNTQAVCISSPITNIQYTIGGTANNASVTGLPPGVTGTYNSGLFIISGSPTSAAGSPYNYTVTTSGTCTAVTATGTITVAPAATLTLTSGAGSDGQTVCKPNPITNITYSISGGTGASATGLPAGVTGTTSGSVFTVSGTPTAAPGTYNYTVTTSGGCGAGTATGSITIQAPTVTLTSGVVSPSVCINTALSNIVYTIGGTATGATVTGLPANVSYNVTGNAVTISGTPNVSGVFPYTITTTGGTCTQSSATGTITVKPAAVGGTLTSVSVCSGASGSLTLSGNSNNPIRWEYSTDFGSTWTTIANTTITQAYNNITVPTEYRAVVDNGCGPVNSSVATVGIHNLWVGNVSSDWNTAANWSDNLVPSTSCPTVTIPVVTGPNVYPILSTGPVATITNLVINSGASVTVTGNTLQIAGTITNNGGTFNAGNGTIEFNGSAVQTIAGSTFMNNAVNGLVVTNTAGVTLAGPLNVYGSLTYGVANGILNTNGNLTLKSTITQTAWIGDMTNHTINGAVTVERYIATGPSATAPNHAKSWQLLAIPTQGQTIKQAWQEGATATNISSPAAGSAGNPVAGYGTMITSNVSANAASQPSPGFDAYTSPGPSMKVYNTLTNGYDGPLNTNTTPIYNQKGYFVFVRGDRSVTAYNQSASPTILRTKGTLFTPANLPPVTSIGNTLFESIGNPYAAPIDMRNITKTSGVAEFIQVWDPRVGGSYNYGAFVTFQLNAARTDYVVGTNGGASYPANGAIFNYLQSGQAFIMQTAPGMTGTVSFNEACKAGNIALPGTGIFTRGASGGGTATSGSTLRTGIYTVNADSTTGELLDGVLDEFGDTYSNGVDGLDARKSMNTGENLSIKTGGKLLVIERRHTVVDNDTIFLNLTNVRVQQYRYHFDAQNLNTVAAGYVVDNYTNTRTPLNLNGGTDVTFNIINVPGAYAANRFMIVFSPLKVLPVTFTSIKAYKQDKNIEVEWRVSNESNIKEYQAEKSVNGIDFTTLSVVKPTNNNGGSAVYVQPDTKPVTGDNYYRIRSIDMNGAISYTTIVKVQIADSRQDINIYPNPITDGQIHLQFLNEPVGKYGLRLLNSLGQVILAKQVTHADGTTTDLIRWNFNLAHGMYKLEITKPDNSLKIINVMY